MPTLVTVATALSMAAWAAISSSAGAVAMAVVEPEETQP
jgi:hypothetical protein